MLLYTKCSFHTLWPKNQIIYRIFYELKSMEQQKIWLVCGFFWRFSFRSLFAPVCYWIELYSDGLTKPIMLYSHINIHNAGEISEKLY
jgi:hypothetical protein